MNQILSTSMPMQDRKNKRNNIYVHQIPTEKILKIFIIMVITFGILIIGVGLYTIVKNQLGTQEENLEPTISIENKTDRIVLLKITHKKAISRVEYSWNDEEPVIQNGNNGQYFEQEITIPAGSNELHVLVVDEEGKEITYDKKYDIQSNINLEVSGNKIKIIYEGNTLISYMTYKWDDGEEIKIDINDKKINQEIDAEKGLHELTIIVVDENNNRDIKKKKINGVSKPEVVVDFNETMDHFVIKAKDEEKLSRIEFYLNENYDQGYVLHLEDMDLKELDYELRIPFEQGQNILEVTVYNSNGVSNSTEQIYYKE